MTLQLPLLLSLIVSCLLSASSTVAPSSAAGFGNDGTLLQRAIAAGMLPTVDVGVVETALGKLLDGSLTLPTPDLTLDFPEPKTPAAAALWMSYMRAVEDSSVPPEAEPAIRALILALVDKGLSTGVSFEKGKFRQNGNLAGTPLGYLYQQMRDPELADAFLANGYDTRGTVLQPTSRPGSSSEGGLGISLLHFLANSGIEIFIVREFYKVSRAVERERATAGDGIVDFDSILRKSTFLSRVLPYVLSLAASRVVVW